MNSEFSDQHLEAQLRAHADNALPDAGFSARVIHALPPRRASFAQRAARYRVLICVLVGAGLWLLSLPSLGAAATSAVTTQEQFNRLIDSVTAMSTPQTAIVLSIWVFCLGLIYAAGSSESAE